MRTVHSDYLARWIARSANKKYWRLARKLKTYHVKVQTYPIFFTFDNAPLGLSCLFGNFFDFQLAGKMLGWRRVYNNFSLFLLFIITFLFMLNVWCTCIPDSKHGGSKCSLHSVEKDVGPDPLLLWVWLSRPTTAYTWDLQETDADIFMFSCVQQQYTWSAFFFRNVQLATWTCMYFHVCYSLQAKFASIAVKARFCIKT